MKCVFCGCNDSKVNETRTLDDGITIRRRRECINCKKRFTTYEKPENILLYVVKKDGRREAFDKDKIRTGMLKALQKRPVSIDQINRAVENISFQVIASNKNEIDSDVIGQLVMQALKELDGIAYIRFASVYLRFSDLESFKNEVDKLIMEQD